MPYIRSLPQTQPYVWGSGDFGARPLGAPAFGLDRVIFTKDCHTGINQGTSYGMVVDSKYIIFSCTAYNAVLVYAKKFGRQKLVEVISPTGADSPEGMIFGP